MRELIIEIGEWAESTFPKSTPETILAHLKREIEEVELENKDFEKVPRIASAEFNNARHTILKNIQAELADIFMLVVHHAYKQEIRITLFDDNFISSLRSSFDHFKWVKYGYELFKTKSNLTEENYNTMSWHIFEVMSKINVGRFLRDTFASIVRDKFEINKLRTWQEPDNEGVCEHIR